MTVRSRPRDSLMLALALGAGIAGWSCAMSAEIPGKARLLDGFETLEPWKAAASDGVTASASNVDGVAWPRAEARLRFREAPATRYVRRELPLDLPENFELTFNLRASAPVNNLEVKLTDASGDNVWWFDRRDFEFPRDWQRIRIKKRQISFAWGPIKDKSLRHTDKIEFVVSAGRGGGNGSHRDRRLAAT